MKNDTVNGNGFVKRKKDTTVEVIAWILAMGFLAFIIFGVLWIRQYRPTPKTTQQKSIAVKVKDSICYNDSIVLSKLIPVLKKREGLALKPYSDGKYKYNYYGHLILSGEDFSNPDSLKADSTLWSDIKKCYWENNRLYRKVLYQNVYDLFISGKLLTNKP